MDMLPRQPEHNEAGHPAADALPMLPRQPEHSEAGHPTGDALPMLPRQLEHNEAGHSAADALDRARRQPDPNAAGRPVRERLDRRLDGNQADPLAQAEAALRKLRADPNDKQAADALERALHQLKERQTPAAKPDLPRIIRPNAQPIR